MQCSTCMNAWVMMVMEDFDVSHQLFNTAFFDIRIQRDLIHKLHEFEGIKIAIENARATSAVQQQGG